jgi:hypothetical protein
MTPEQIAHMLMKSEEYERLSYGFYAPVYVVGKDLARYVRKLSDEVLRLRRENEDLLTNAQVGRLADAATPLFRDEDAAHA